MSQFFLNVCILDFYSVGRRVAGEARNLARQNYFYQ